MFPAMGANENSPFLPKWTSLYAWWCRAQRHNVVLRHLRIKLVDDDSRIAASALNVPCKDANGL